MAAWTVVPCLLALRDEFNRINPKRDKGADGTIGDSSHTSASDHTPDEDSDVLRDHDADSKNEVHALDIDSTGPWGGRSFNDVILALVARERAEYNHPTTRARLKYVIWNRRIASRSNAWNWAPYTGSSAHTDHAHFSALYTTVTENDTRPWGVAPVAAPTPEAPDMTKSEMLALLNSAEGQAAIARAAGVGVHGQRLGKSQTTIGQALQATSALARVEALLAEVAARPAGGAPSVAELTEALRDVLREGIGE